MKFGCIADDFTGATDLAGLLRRSGASVKLHFGLPDQPSDGLSDIEIIALKCRTGPVAQAVSDCSEAALWLLAGGAELLYWKYCSTFDSTDQGNIGPVAEALMATLSTIITEPLNFTVESNDESSKVNGILSLL